MIFHEYKCIFIHIPKTAGTSIEHKLGQFRKSDRGFQDHRSIREIEPDSMVKMMSQSFEGDPYISRPKLVRKLAKKYFLQQLRKDEYVTPEQYESYYKFAFVRNPWARVFSWYKNVVRDENHQKDLGVAPNCSFKEFLQNHLDQWAVRPQLYWLVDRKGNIPLDFIGRFENLSEDFAAVCQTLGIKDMELPKLVTGDGQKYTKVYDDETIEIVARKYRDEIALFEYKFGD